MTKPLKQTIDLYCSAKDWLLDHGSLAEIEWQTGSRPDEITEHVFLREAAWVVYCCGFREAVVRRIFDHLSLCFFDWSSARDISESAAACTASAMRVFANRKKHDAIVTIARHLTSIPFPVFLRSVNVDPIGILAQLPYLGPVTSCHLAKNLGFEVAKPDRHLVRLAAALGFDNADHMCTVLANATGDPVRVVDLVLWRSMEQAQSTHPPQAINRLTQFTRDARSNG